MTGPVTTPCIEGMRILSVPFMVKSSELGAWVKPMLMFASLAPCSILTNVDLKATVSIVLEMKPVQLTGTASDVLDRGRCVNSTSLLTVNE